MTCARKSPNGLPTEVERVTGIPGDQLKRVAEMLAKEKPATIIWCMGQTQHSVGTANVRACCTVLLATGNIGAPGCGANIFRGHTNVQGATDLGLDVTTLPLYYGLTEGAWRHWARVWDVPYEWLVSRFDAIPSKAGRPARTPKQNMETPGITSTRWFDGALLPADDIDQRSPIRALMVFVMAATPSRGCPKRSKVWARSTCWWSETRIRPPSRRSMRAATAPTCCRSARRSKAMGRERPPTGHCNGRADRQAGLRVEGRLRGDLSVGQQARLRRTDVQAHRDRQQPAVAGGHPAGDQPWRLVDRLLRAIARAPQGAHEAPRPSSTS